MKDPFVYHVVGHGAHWVVRLVGSGTSGRPFGSLHEAVTAARDMAAGTLPSRVLVLDRDGGIAQSWEYGGTAESARCAAQGT